MSVVDVISVLAAAVSTGMGVMGAVSPSTAMRVTGLQFDPNAPHAISEVRATFGGLFIAMSVFALLSADPLAYAAVGSGWLGAAMLRLVSIAYDRIPTRANFQAVIGEGVIGAGMVAMPLARWLAA